MCHNLTGLFPLGFHYFSPIASFLCAFAQIIRGRPKEIKLGMGVVGDVMSFNSLPSLR